MASINSLPLEIISQIIDRGCEGWDPLIPDSFHREKSHIRRRKPFMTNIERVCYQWRELAKDKQAPNCWITIAFLELRAYGLPRFTKEMMLPYINCLKDSRGSDISVVWIAHRNEQLQADTAYGATIERLFLHAMDLLIPHIHRVVGLKAVLYHTHVSLHFERILRNPGLIALESLKITMWDHPEISSYEGLSSFIPLSGFEDDRAMMSRIEPKTLPSLHILSMSAEEHVTNQYMRSFHLETIHTLHVRYSRDFETCPFQIRRDIRILHLSGFSSDLAKCFTHLLTQLDIFRLARPDFPNIQIFPVLEYLVVTNDSPDESWQVTPLVKKFVKWKHEVGSPLISAKYYCLGPRGYKSLLGSWET